MARILSSLPFLRACAALRKDRAMATKRKRTTNNGPSLVQKKKKVPKPVEEEEDDIDAMIAAEEAKAENETETGVSLADLADSDEEVGDAEDNKYYKNVEEDSIFEGDEELEAYIESKKTGLLRPSINNHKGLQKKLMEIIDGAPWPETLAITAEDDLDCEGRLIIKL